MSVKDSVATVFSALVAFGVGVLILTSMFLIGFGVGYKQSINSEHFYEQKYQGVIQALIGEAKWSHIEIINLKNYVLDGKSAGASSSSSSSQQEATSSKPAAK